jgi:hypothetical protein
MGTTMRPSILNVSGVSFPPLISRLRTSRSSTLGPARDVHCWLASEFPFKRILGLEFSPELHKAAEGNIQRYSSATQKCRDIQSLNVDFADYALPPEASVLFFFHPCRTRVLSEVVAGIGRSLLSYHRLLYVAYVAPTLEQEQLFASSGFLEKISENPEFRFCLYRAL